MYLLYFSEEKGELLYTFNSKNEFNLKVWGFLLIFILITFVTIMSEIYPKQMLINFYMQKYHFDLKANDGKKYDLLIAGDSTVYRGINPSIMNQIVNKKSLNFAFSSQRLSKYYLNEINKRIKKNGILIFGINIRSFSLNKTSKSGIEFIHKNNPRVFPNYVYIYLNTLFPSFNFLKMMSNSLNNYYTSNGWVTSFSKVDLPLELTIKSINKYKSHKINYRMIKYFFKYVKEMTRKGYRVFIYNSILNNNIKSFDNKVFYKYDFENNIKDSGGIFLKTNNYYKTYDGIHLNKSNSVKLSNEIGNSVKLLLL